MTVKTALRTATPNDAAAVAELMTQLGYASGPEQAATRLAALRAMQQGLVVAEVGGMVIGVVHVNRWATLMADDVAEIVALVVDNAWRGRGIGRALLRAAEEWASHRGCSVLHVRTNIVRQRAHGFYLGNGFRQVKTSLTLVKELADHGEREAADAP